MSEHLIEKKHSIRREGETQARFMDSTSDARNVSDAYALPGRDAHQTIAGAQAQTATPPLVTQTIPAGAQQGGLIDWFRNRLVSNRSEEAAVEPQLLGIERNQSSESLAVEEARRQGGNPARTPTQDEEPQYVAEDPPEGNALQSFPVEEQEPVDKPPYFETHSYRSSATNLHSYVGLRYTVFDPKERRYRRHHIKAGFGCGWKLPFGPSRLMNDWQSEAQASTETPISVERLKRMFDVIPQDQKSHSYGVLHSNCNHFTKRMADAAGAVAAAEIHDAVSPTTVRNRLLKRAGEGVTGALGATRIIYAGNEVLDRQAFMELARKAAQEDGINLGKYADTLEQIGEKLNNSAALRRGEEIRQIVAQVESILKDNVGTASPHMNALLLKTLSEIRHIVDTNSIAIRRRGLDNLYSGEKQRLFANMGNKERAAQGGAVSNRDFYSRANATDQTLLGRELIANIGDISYNTVQSWLSQRNQMEITEKGVFECISERMQRLKVRLNPFIHLLLQARANLTDSQLSELLLQAYFDQLGVFSDPHAVDLTAKVDIARDQNRAINMRTADNEKNGWQASRDSILETHNVSSEQREAIDGLHALSSWLADAFKEIRAVNAEQPQDIPGQAIDADALVNQINQVIRVGENPQPGMINQAAVQQPTNDSEGGILPEEDGR